MSEAVAVEVRGIRRTYGTTHALDGLDLVLAPGELLALLGPSGCGKTTALRLLAGFDRPTAGRVLIGGRDVTDVSASRRDTGMVFQAYSLFPTMTAAENVAFGLRMRKVAAAARGARARELLALLGPSGCGKTTALRLLAGFDTPTSGQVLIGGKDVTGIPASKRDTGMVFQAYSLFPTMTAAENVAFGLRMRRVGAAERARRAAELLEVVGLGDRGGSYPHEMSGGQQQRVALARALAVSPSVLLLDEPLSALDARVRVQLRDEIRRVQLAEGITTLFVTHDQAEALAVADRVAVLNKGRLEQVDTPQEVYTRPATEFVAEFVGVTNHVPVVDGRIRPGAETRQVRPEGLAVGDPDGLPATVLTSTFLGAVTRLVVTTEVGELIVDVTSRPDLPAAGEPTTVTLAP